MAANSALRTRLAGEAEALGMPLIVPRPALCTDNGAMIGAAGARRFEAGVRAGTDLDAKPSLPLARAGDAAEPATLSRPGAGSAVPDVPSPTRPRLDALAVRRTLREAGLRPRHRLSQNFLADVDVLEGILAEADPGPGDRVLEIGPGSACSPAGSSTPARRSPRSSWTTGWSEQLRGRFAEPLETGQLRLIEGDALDQDLVHLVAPPYDVVANLPYHVTSPDAAPAAGPRPARAAARAHGPARGRGAGRLRAGRHVATSSVFVQYHARVRIAFRVPREAFEPAPEVESAVIVLEPFDETDRLDAARWRTTSGGWSRRASASGARCSTTCCAAS